MGEKSSLESPTETKEELKIERRTRTSQPKGLWEDFQHFCLLFVQQSVESYSRPKAPTPCETDSPLTWKGTASSPECCGKDSHQTCMTATSVPEFLSLAGSTYILNPVSYQTPYTAQAAEIYCAELAKLRTLHS